MGYTVHWQQRAFTDFTWATIVKLVPKVIQSEFMMTEWGFVIHDIVQDCGSFIERYPTQITGTKTNRLPYTRDFMKALILMVEFGAADELNHDDTDMSMFLNALEELHAIHPLVSYEQQKEYFNHKN